MENPQSEHGKPSFSTRCDNLQFAKIETTEEMIQDNFLRGRDSKEVQ